MPSPCAPQSKPAKDTAGQSLSSSPPPALIAKLTPSALAFAVSAAARGLRRARAMDAAFEGFKRVLRDAEWLDARRARAYCLILFIVTALCMAGWAALSHGGVDPRGKPLGTDFTSFWTASQLALAGRPEAAYDLAAHHGAQSALFGRDLGYAAFFYPPAFLLICLPLALAPYLASLGLWLAGTLLAYLAAMRAWLDARAGLVPILAFPAVMATLGHGQNAFLTAALLGGGCALLNRRPTLAGLLLGALIFKPHLGLVIPVALVAARRWRSLAAAGAAALALCGASALVFGASTWSAFFAATALARGALDDNLVGDEKMISVFAALRLLGVGNAVAYAAQALAALGVCASLASLQRRAFRCEAEGAALAAATLLASPFALDYDLTILAIPLAWLVSQGLRGGFLPYEKSLAAAAFILPAIARPLAGALGLPLAPLVVAAIFAAVVRRAFASADAAAPAMAARFGPALTLGA